jgi:hypothetical protein
MPFPKDTISSCRHTLESQGAIIISILTLSSLISTGVGYYYSIDVRGWWLLMLFFEGALNLAYVVAYLGIAKFARHFTMTAALWHAAAIMSAQQIHSLLFYTVRPDWGAINTGLAELTPLQSIIHSYLSYYGIYAVSLLVAGMQALVARSSTR